MNTQKWTSQLDKITAEFKQAFGSLSAEELNWKPDAQSWSIAQNLDHLMVINSSYFPVIQSIHQGTYTLPMMGRIGFVVNLLGKTLLAAVQPGKGKKTKTFPIWEPSSSQLPADIISRFEQHQKDLKQVIISSEELLDKGAVISSPANKHIVYKLETAFDIIVAHEQRHLEQAKGVLAKQREQASQG